MLFHILVICIASKFTDIDTQTVTPQILKNTSQIQAILHKRVENWGKDAQKPENIKKYLELGQKIVFWSYEDV